MISVCIPTYNGERYIAVQIKSILDQLKDDDEIIISDDNSTDLTISIIKGFNDNRIKIFRNSTKVNNFKGLFRILYAVNRNVSNALVNASGEFIFLADQDDIWEKDKIEKILPYLKNYDIVVHDCKIFDDRSGETIQESYFNLVKPSKSFFRTLYKSSFHGCCMAFTKKLKDKSLPIPDLPIGHDTWIGLVGCNIGNVFFYSEKLIKYRRHENNVSASGEVSPNSLLFKIRYRVLLVFAKFLILFKR